MDEDIELLRGIQRIRYFVQTFHKQGKATAYSGGTGSLTRDEEKYLDAIQEAVDAKYPESVSVSE